MGASLGACHRGYILDRWLTGGLHYEEGVSCFITDAGGLSPHSASLPQTSIISTSCPTNFAMLFNLKKIFSKKSRAQVCILPWHTNILLTHNLQTLPTPPVLRKSPVVGSSSRGSSPASSCSTLVGAPSIEHKHLTIVQSLHAEPSHDVWLVAHNHTKQHFTLSVYRTHLLTAEQRARLSDERMMMLLLSESDEFVKIISHWDGVGEKYILTDYYPYTLADALHDQPFNKGQARLYAAHIVRFPLALNYWRLTIAAGLGAHVPSPLANYSQRCHAVKCTYHAYRSTSTWWLREGRHFYAWRPQLRRRHP